MCTFTYQISEMLNALNAESRIVRNVLLNACEYLTIFSKEKHSPVVI